MTIAREYDQALTIIRRLNRTDRARLVSQVVQELATEPVADMAQQRDPRTTMAAVRAHFAAQGPVSPGMGEQLDADRQHRADLLEGRIRE